MLLMTPSFAADYKTMSHEYDLAFQSFLREKIEIIKPGSVVRVSFKHSPDAWYRFVAYGKTDDSVWVEPLKNTHHYGIWKLLERKAFAIQELQDVVKFS